MLGQRPAQIPSGRWLSQPRWHSSGLMLFGHGLDGFETARICTDSPQKDDAGYPLLRHTNFMTGPLLHAELTRSVIAAFFEVYNELTFGFREHIYVNAIDKELVRRGHVVAREVGTTVWFKDENVGSQRLDVVVDNKIIVEVKAMRVLHQSAIPQLTSYLKGTEFEVGLLLHFGEKPKFYRCILTNDQKKNIRALSVQNPSNPCPDRILSEDA